MSNNLTDDIQDVDFVSVEGLQLPQGVLSYDIWSRTVQQPASLDIRLQLQQGLATAASSDALDRSTIHYGILCKSIRKATADEARGIEDTFRCVQQVIQDLAMPAGTTDSTVWQAEVSCNLPKASISGQNIKITDTYQLYEDTRSIRTTRRTIVFEKLRTPTLIGVNAVERTAPQSLVVTASFILQLQSRNHDLSHGTDLALTYEQALLSHIQQTKFETLEALAEHLYRAIADDFKTRPQVIGLSLKLEKPSAVIYAEAPAIEIVRSFKER